MSSLILRVTAVFLLPLLLLFSIFLLLRGHNEPGGGFVAGLVTAAAFILYAIGFDVAAARRVLGFDLHMVIGVGLLIALIGGLPSLFLGSPFLTGIWVYLPIPGMSPLDLGTPLLFDVGVYLAVAGMTLLVVLSLAED